MLKITFRLTATNAPLHVQHVDGAFPLPGDTVLLCYQEHLVDRRIWDFSQKDHTPTLTLFVSPVIAQLAPVDPEIAKPAVPVFEKAIPFKVCKNCLYYLPRYTFGKGECTIAHPTCRLTDETASCPDWRDETETLQRAKAFTLQNKS